MVLNESNTFLVKVVYIRNGIKYDACAGAVGGFLNSLI